jgi:hypothetical protein
MTNKGQYCHKCTHAREKVIPRVWICKINCVHRNQTDVCLWDTKKNPSKFEPLPEATDEQVKTIQKLREFIKSHRVDGSCPFGSMNEGKCHEYNDDENGGCSLCIFDHAVDSLIKGDPPK